ncbi:MAG: 23S rRNA (uracil(1939)-C(5))-methyltransferase RlmD [Candidatus Polarisedimenticolaceae bacterium]|nr:23S rRNA (uracil(1939)-C(5))-methyltransferase RlmD [Candidatus Polarisedimenticolaceae bacterium]
MSRKRRKNRLPAEPIEAEIESLNHDGRGVAHVDEKAVFIYGGLPGEKVRFRYLKRKRSYDEGTVVEVLSASPKRVEPRCEQFGICGGCSLQHMDSQSQIEAKQQVLLENLEHIGKVAAEHILPPLTGEAWGYRRKARLGAKFVTKHGKVFVGFRERGTSFITDTAHCAILHPKVGTLLSELASLIDGLSINNKVPQVEMSMGDEVCVLIFRIMEPITESDRQKLGAFGQQHDLNIYLQESGPESVRPLEGIPARLSYKLPDFDLELEFLPSDFTQVNSDINRKMLNLTMQLLEPKADERVLDLFCGVGNFTLPLARLAKQVTGVEGDAGLVARARENAERNGLNNVNFHVANLYESLEGVGWLNESFDKVLLDPPRSGAAEILEHLPKMGAKRIVYVSCYPGTLARDAGILVNQHGYQLKAAGVMDMFPHTGHVESIALFEKA